LSDKDWTRISEIRIFGGGPLSELVHSHSVALRKKGRPIVLGGYLNRVEATALYEWADYVLLPSRVESIPVVFSDAMQTKCPLIAMPVGDIPLLMNKKTVGFLANTLEPLAFARAIHAALASSPNRFAKNLNYMNNQFDLARAACRLSGMI
jgi:glycosyltransferase involved in cell wall biosynthesis